MRGLVRFIARLYPARWRERYGTEFGALLDDVDPDWRTLLDTAKGALGAQMHAWKRGWVMITAFAAAGALIALGISSVFRASMRRCVNRRRASRRTA